MNLFSRFPFHTHCLSSCGRSVNKCLLGSFLLYLMDLVNLESIDSWFRYLFKGNFLEEKFNESVVQKTLLYPSVSAPTRSKNKRSTRPFIFMPHNPRHYSTPYEVQINSKCLSSKNPAHIFGYVGFEFCRVIYIYLVFK